MNEYYILDEIEIPLKNFDDEALEHAYQSGYLITRKKKGVLYKSRSLRINLRKFSVNSKNRRVLNRNTDLIIEMINLPISQQEYDWRIHYMGKEFYTQRFGNNIFSASKIKSMVVTNNENPNLLLKYTYENTAHPVGYCFALRTKKFLHYAYPFYDLSIPSQRFLGMAMLIKAILLSIQLNMDYFYIGTVTDQKSKYKLQFNALEWFNEYTNTWDKNISKLKSILNS
ncbi:MAG: hypothetical protein NZZ41_06375 [Candidatus Dojkabacteria bacterium]|nr:hypothetical protein [Candidatus Dojkabacteria bacterium]